MKKLFYIGAMSVLLLSACGVDKAEDTDNAQEQSDKAKEKEAEKAKKEAEKEAKQKAKEEEKKAKEEEEIAKQEAKEAEKEEKKKAKEEAKLKEEQADKEKEAKKKAEKEAKAKSKEEEKITKQKEYFVKNTQPAIDEWVKTYDQLWDGIWKPTFEAIGNGSRDVYTAYDNMKSLKEGYRSLTLKDSVPVDGLSKEQQKTIKDAMRDLTYAAASRQLAAEKAMKMFDTSDFSPSQMDKIKSDVAAADTQMMKGVIGITKVKQELGLIEGAKK